MAKAKTSIIGNLSTVERVAMAKGSNVCGSFKDGVSPSIPTGVYEGSFTVKVDFKVTKQDPYETPPTVNLMSKAVIAKAVVMSGIQADNFFAALEKAALEAFQTKEKVSDVVAEEDFRVQKRIDELTASVISKLPLAKRSGDTKVEAKVQVLEAHAAEENVEPEQTVAHA